jgi:hypothetical protein
MKDDNMKTYTITCTEDQAGLIQDALEYYARLLAGQMGLVSQQMIFQSNPKRFTDAGRRIIRDYCDAIEADILVDFTGTPDRLIDMMQVIRHHRAWDNMPTGGFGVSFDKPMYRSGDVPIEVAHHENPAADTGFSRCQPKQKTKRSKRKGD